jgi:aminoglycoside 3'-phosphotransferase-2
MKRSLPLKLQVPLDGYRWQHVTIGESGAETFRLSRRGRPTLVLKTSSDNPHLSLRGEADRLLWLAGRIGAPAAVEYIRESDKEWLLMTALPGTNALEARLPAHVTVDLVANALRALHAIDAATCPFDEALDRKIARAGANLAAGLVEEEHFDERNRGRSATDLFSELLSRRPATQELVVTHGDACLPNFMIDGARFSGLVDCDRVGRSDRYQDLALACRSIEYDLGERWVASFLERYGLSDVDQDRIEFYRLLDEFF